MSRNSKGQFTDGNPERRAPVGSVRIRTRHKRNGEQRAFVKTAEPNVWRLRAQVVWEAHNGAIPPGFDVHHKDENKLNDDISNLELLTRAKHLATHRPTFKDRAVEGFIKARRERRWSTKSDTKRTGHPPSWSDEQLHAAIEAYRVGKGTQAAIEREFNLPARTLSKQLKRLK